MQQRGIRPTPSRFPRWGGLYPQVGVLNTGGGRIGSGQLFKPHSQPSPALGADYKASNKIRVGEGLSGWLLPGGARGAQLPWAIILRPSWLKPALRASLLHPVSSEKDMGHDQPRGREEADAGDAGVSHQLADVRL